MFDEKKELFSRYLLTSLEVRAYKGLHLPPHSHFASPLTNTHIRSKKKTPPIYETKIFCPPPQKTLRISQNLKDLFLPTSYLPQHVTDWIIWWGDNGASDIYALFRNRLGCDFMITSGMGRRKKEKEGMKEIPAACAMICLFAFFFTYVFRLCDFL